MTLPTTPTPVEDLRREAVRLLNAAADTSPAELKAEVDEAERALVGVRDALINRLRTVPDDDARAALKRVNMALSLVVGLEYPMGGLQRTMLKDALTVLQAPL